MKLKDRLDQLFRWSEDLIYAVIGFLLISTALFIVISTFKKLAHHLQTFDSTIGIIHVIDGILLTIMVVEILYSIRVSLKSHALCAEPFFIVGLVAAIRRILMISVESAYLTEKFRMFMIEMTVLGFIILVFVIAIVLLRRNIQHI